MVRGHDRPAQGELGRGTLSRDELAFAGRGTLCMRWRSVGLEHEACIFDSQVLLRDHIGGFAWTRPFSMIRSGSPAYSIQAQNQYPKKPPVEPNGKNKRNYQLGHSMSGPDHVKG